MDSDGNIVFHGRIDDQVKIRGFRVELGEIEAQLAAIAGVAQAAVVLRRDAGLDRLAAFLVMEGEAGLDPSALRGGAARDAAALHGTRVISRRSRLCRRLSSGKIDRKSLQNVELTIAEPEGEEDLPHNAVEGFLLAAARQVFEDHTGLLDSDFFTELGGHSLLAARFISIVRQTPELASHHAPGPLRQADPAGPGPATHRADAAATPAT